MMLAWKIISIEAKTDLWDFMRFLDTMKIHGIIENDCEDLIAIWRTNIELARHRVIWWLSICPSDTNARTRRSRPSSRQEVTMVGHFHSCFKKYSQESNQVYIYQALSNHMLWNFWLKIPGFEPASVDCPDFFESRVKLFIIFYKGIAEFLTKDPLTFESKRIWCDTYYLNAAPQALYNNILLYVLHILLVSL